MCDVWAREFMTARLESYAKANGHDYHKVLRQRSMGLALAALILHEITPVWDHGGNNAYFSVGLRLETLLKNTRLPSDDHFWVFAASLLVGIYRQKGTRLDVRPMPPRELAEHLIAGL